MGGWVAGVCKEAELKLPTIVKQQAPGLSKLQLQGKMQIPMVYL